MMQRSSAVARAAAAPIGFGVAVVVLVLAGRGDLAAPPVSGFEAWLEARGAVVAAVAFLRLAALGAATWMFVVASMASAARLLGAARLATRLERGLPPLARRALTALVGVGTAGAAVLGGDSGSTTVVAGAAPVSPPVELVATPGQTPPASPTDATVTMSVLPSEPAAPAPASESEASWTVAPGDSFWSITEELLADDLGRMPTDAEVVPRWRALIDANRDRLLTGDPDLIFPGQVFRVPPTA